LDINKTWRSKKPGPTNDPLINGEPIALRSHILWSWDRGFTLGIIELVNRYD